MGRRSRVPVVSLLVDAAYGSLPAPFFVGEGGRLAPHVMMDNVPGSALVAAALAQTAGSVWLGAWLGGPLMAACALVPVLVHYVLFLAHGLPQQSEKLFDLAGQLAFLAMAWLSAWHSALDDRQLAATALATLWSLRLGAFLFLRFLERRSDFRFEAARGKRGYSFYAWTTQGNWCFLQGLALLVAQQAPHGETVNGTIQWTVRDYAGWTLFLGALFVESVADLQKLVFVRRFPTREARPYIADGLWRFSRHVNFGAEALVHIAMAALVCAPMYKEPWQVAVAASSALFSPVFLMQTSVPWLEHIADERFGDSPKYKRFKEDTSVFWPLPKRPLFL